MTARQMIDLSRAETGYEPVHLAAAIDAANACAQACTACADACLAEDMVQELRRCITVDLACADICTATARILSRQTAYVAEVTNPILDACRTACGRCADECEQHASMHEHCRLCAAACRRCQDACNRLLQGA